MGRKNKRVVYSTNPDFEYEDEQETIETLAPHEQVLSVHIDKKNRGGKVAVVVKGFIGNADDLQQLGKDLKAACGVGGSAKGGEIIIQGDKRDKVMDLLNQKGYKTKRVGG